MQRAHLLARPNVRFQRHNAAIAATAPSADISFCPTKKVPVNQQ